MNAWKAKEGICGRCDKKAVIVMRVEGDSGPEFECFCVDHLDAAVKIISDVREQSLGNHEAH